MVTSLHVGIASQTPLVRAKEVPQDVSPGTDVLSLDRMTRGVHYSVTPGGVARMVHAFLSVPEARGLTGEWAALGTGFPFDLQVGRVRLRAATLPEWAQAGYKEFKEVVWEAINGLPPKAEDPDANEPAIAAGRKAYEAWSVANAQALLAGGASRFDVLYVNDWQQMPQGRLLEGRPRVMHFHAPYASWTPPAWARFMRRHFEGFDAVIVSTDAYADALRASGFKKPIVRVYPWLLPEARADPSAAEVQAASDRGGLRASDRVVLNVARMDPVKGQDRLLRAFPAVLRRHPDAKLVFIGNGSFSSSKTAGMGLSKGKVWRQKLEALAAQLSIADRVVFTGHLPQPDVDALYRRADVFAFPSVAEGFGLAVAEAWLAEKPVVVSRGAGISELIADGENGFVVDGAHTDELADGVSRALSLKDGGASMGAEGLRTALEWCDVRRSARAVLGVLEAVAEKRAPAPTLERATRANRR